MACFLKSLSYPSGLRWICVCSVVYASQANGPIRSPLTCGRFTSQLGKKCLSLSSEVRGSCNNSGAVSNESFCSLSSNLEGLPASYVSYRFHAVDCDL